MITALKNKAKDLDKSTKIHNADLKFGHDNIDQIIVLKDRSSTVSELTQQIFIAKSGQAQIVESLDGQINNRLTLGTVNQVYIEDNDGHVEIIDV